MNMTVQSLAGGIMLMIFLLGCKGQKTAEKDMLASNIKDVPESSWKMLSGKKVFFGHQSVGFNIVDGIKDVIRENPHIILDVVETRDADMFNRPIFAHGRVGKNTDPVSKVDDFSRQLQSGIGSKADIVFMKFCYVDVTAKTDVEKVFAYYKSSLDRLQKIYPKTIFIHITVPLTSVQTGFKARVKKIFGRLVGEEDNVRREKFNELLRKEYSRNGLLFDLAEIESTTVRGERASFWRDGKKGYYLLPDYTYDGGHLNEKGRRIVAKQLLMFLASLQ